MPYSINKPIEIELTNIGIRAIKGKTKAKDFNKQMKKLKGILE